MNVTLTRAKTLLTAVPTYLVMASVVLTILMEEVSKVLPGDSAEAVGRWVGVVLSVIGAAILIVRRVTPVVVADRGLIPIEHPLPEPKDPDVLEDIDDIGGA